MTAVAGLGPWAGSDVLEEQTAVVGELTSTPTGVDGLPFLVQLPGRGYGSEPVGRATVFLAELSSELGPHGWKLADRPGRDSSRAAAFLREDLDALAVAAYGYVGPVVVSTTGPLTLAASLYLARGDRVLSDPGAVRELAESLGAGIAEHLAALRVAVPGAEPVLALDETRLAEVLLGRVATFSGNSVIRAVVAGVASERLRTVADAARAAGAGRVVVHSGPSWIPVRTIVAAGADGLGLTIEGFDDRGWERIGEAVEAGVALWASLPAALPDRASSRKSGPDVVGQAAELLRPWGRLGMPAAALRDVVVLPAAVPTAPTPDAARTALADVIRATEIVAERAEEG